MPAMLPIVVADASVVVKWFHASGEESVADARALLDAYADGRIELAVLDLTRYEVGNALVRGVGAGAEATASVLEALDAICEPTTPTATELARAARIATDHGLTFYDAAYAAVAVERGAHLATVDRDLLAAGFGTHPATLEVQART